MLNKGFWNVSLFLNINTAYPILETRLDLIKSVIAWPINGHMYVSSNYSKWILSNSHVVYVNSRIIALTCCRMGHCAFLHVILWTGNSFRWVHYFNIFKQHFNRSEYHLPYQFTRTYICTCSIFMLNFNERSKYLI